MEKADDRKLLRDLYPGLTEAEIKEVGENLEKYLDLMLRIYDRIADDPALSALLDQKHEEK